MQPPGVGGGDEMGIPFNPLFIGSKDATPRQQGR